METEKRMIDANSIIKKIDHYYNSSPFSHPGTTWLRGLELALGLILAEPTVDVVHAVHGKAVPIPANFDSDDTLIRMDRLCSECGALITQMDNYCPNCGAKMDGDRN